MKRSAVLLALALAVACLAPALLHEDASAKPTKAGLHKAVMDQVDPAMEVVAVKKAVIAGREFTFVKMEDDAGEDASEMVFDHAAEAVDASVMPEVPPQMMTESLRQVVAETEDPDAVIRINVALQIEEVEDETEDASGSMSLSGTAETADASEGDAALTMNGKDVSAIEVIAQAEKSRAISRSMRAQRRDGARRTLRELAARHDMMDHPDVQLALRDGHDTVTLDVTRSTLDGMMTDKSYGLVAGAELYIEPQDTLTSALTSSRVDPWALDYDNRQGEGVGIYMTESGCPPDSFLTNFDNLGGSNTNHSRNVSAIMRGVSPKSYIYCRGGAVLPQDSDLDGVGEGNPAIHIVNRSNGGGDNDDYTTVDRDWDNFVYDHAVATFVSAGNNGDDNGYLIFPSKGFNIISVGAYDDSNDTIADFSSYLDPETGVDKPEISAPGVNITAGGFTLSGTSMSSPHAAAFAADLMGRYTWLKNRPYLVKALMMSGAWKSISGGVNKVGLGGVDFYRTYYSFRYSWREGNNSSFERHDNADSMPGNGRIDFTYDLNASDSKVRVVLVWLNRGTWTYAHRSDAHPIGMDLDLRVYDPNGRSVGSSASYDNSYEVVEFDPQVTGTYRASVNRYANRDTSSKVHIGLLWQR